MGSELSSCCGGAAERGIQIDFSSSPGETNSTTAQTDDVSLSPVELEGARARFYKGFDVHLILQDKTRLVCQVQMDPTHEFLLLSCNKKARVIHMKDIKAILHTPEELSRVETSAGITDADACAAIHLESSGNCIPLFFNSVKDKLVFLDVVQEARLAHKPT